MPRKKVQAEEEERWITGKEATELLRKNSGRADISDTYIRSLARAGKVATKPLDGRTNVYKYSDIASYRVEHRDKGKGDTVAARKAGSRRKQHS